MNAYVLELINTSFANVSLSRHFIFQCNESAVCMFKLITVSVSLFARLLSSTYQFSLKSMNSPHMPPTSNLDELEPLLPHQCTSAIIPPSRIQNKPPIIIFLPLINSGSDGWRCKIDLREQNSLKLLKSNDQYVAQRLL